jgi:sulfatase modifying factor 1
MVGSPTISLLLSFLASVSVQGCSLGGTLPLQPLAAPSAAAEASSGALLALHRVTRAALTARGASPATTRPAAFETTSPRAEYAASFTVRITDVQDDPEDPATALVTASQRCPMDMAFVENRVCVDRWEASLLERVLGGERAWSPYLPVDGHELSIRAVSRPGVIPQGYISGKQAQTACNASGKRLCTSSEWEHACRGPSTTQFPYGPARRAGACNDDMRALHPVAEAGLMLGIPRDALWRAGMNQSLINQLPATLLPAGERAECTNEYGVFDMVGNLHEWVDDPDGTFRGGYYMDTSHNGEGCAYATTAHDFSYHDYSTGFRCCADPERVE